MVEGRSSGGSGGLLDPPFCIRSNGVQEAYQPGREVVHFGLQHVVLSWREQTCVARELQVTLGLLDRCQRDGDVAGEDRLRLTACALGEIRRSRASRTKQLA